MSKTHYHLVNGPLDGANLLCEHLERSASGQYDAYMKSSRGNCCLHYATLFHLKNFSTPLIFCGWSRINGLSHINPDSIHFD